ncbi:MAG: hypothetical protein HRU35_01710 [Rickettsiaceae bacterium]|nr:hypothetical protein [Rickettsiaceae bacterium]
MAKSQQGEVIALQSQLNVLRHDPMMTSADIKLTAANYYDDNSYTYNMEQVVKNFVTYSIINFLQVANYASNWAASFLPIAIKNGLIAIDDKSPIAIDGKDPIAINKDPIAIKDGLIAINDMNHQHSPSDLNPEDLSYADISYYMPQKNLYGYKGNDLNNLHHSNYSSTISISLDGINDDIDNVLAGKYDDDLDKLTDNYHIIPVAANIIDDEQPLYHQRQDALDWDDIDIDVNALKDDKDEKNAVSIEFGDEQLTDITTPSPKHQYQQSDSEYEEDDIEIDDGMSVISNDDVAEEIAYNITDYVNDIPKNDDIDIFSNNGNELDNINIIDLVNELNIQLPENSGHMDVNTSAVAYAPNKPSSYLAELNYNIDNPYADKEMDVTGKIDNQGDDNQSTIDYMD